MSVISNAQKEQQEKAVTQYDVVIVGAGPYGLSIAAHLLAKGLNVAIFGKPLELWREHMPRGMNLRSHWWATNLSDPKQHYTFKRFLKLKGYSQEHPTPMAHFIEYATWFQQNVVPNVDETYVASIERNNGLYTVNLEDGRVVRTPSVVMAIGVYYFANKPTEYDVLPPELVSHSFEYANFERFKGKHVLIVGAGQSGVENAALAYEEGVEVSLLARRPILWLAPDRTDERTLKQKIQAPNAGIAPGWANWALEAFPYLFYRLSQPAKDKYLRTHYNAAASDWLFDRTKDKVHIYEQRTVTQLEPKDGGCDVTLSDGERFHVDHIMLATGYVVNVKKMTMLAPALLEQLREDNGIPQLNSWFETNMPGLYFVGLSSIRGFGPLYRFVVGAKAAAPRVASAVARRAARHK